MKIKAGVEPSENMARVAAQRGIQIIRAVAEELPIKNNSFDFASMITTVCFLYDIPKAFSEVHRILKPQGEVIHTLNKFFACSKDCWGLPGKNEPNIN